MMLAHCHNCDRHTLCANVVDIGWICPDCRRLWAPPDHLLPHQAILRPRLPEPVELSNHTKESFIP